jgi:hypothetical protein
LGSSVFLVDEVGDLVEGEAESASLGEEGRFRALPAVAGLTR